MRSATITAGVVMALYLILMLSGAAINLINPGIDPAQENMVWAAMNVMPTFVGVLLLPEGKLFWITYFAGTLFASSWGPVAFMSVWSSRITEAGAFWGIIAGLLGNVVTNALALLHIVDLPVILDPILVGVALSYITVELVSRKSTVSDKEHALRERLHQVPESEIDPVKLRRTLLWPGGEPPGAIV